jgi:hypothetical protein
VKYLKVKSRLGIVLAAGAVLAACGTTSNTVTTSTPAKTPAKAPVKTKPVSSTNVGFNASKSAFVLPYGLGNLPAPELALAKSDPTYATALKNKADWIDVKPGKGETPADYGYFFTGGSTPSAIGQLLSVKTIASTLRAMTPTGVDVTALSPIAVQSSQLVSISLSSAVIPNALRNRTYEVVTPTVLEIRAAPVGTLSIHGAATTAICIPSPEALIQSGKIVTPSGVPSITSGPDTIFASSATTGAPTEYTQGTSTCSSFS